VQPPKPYLIKDPGNFVLVPNAANTYSKQREKLMIAAQAERGINHVNGWSFVRD
jgi:hypothetical protein